jgi:hypothetical protein
MDSSDFADRLLPNERVVWTGKPATGLRLSKRDIFLIPFSLLWCGFAVFWEWSVLKTPAPVFMAVWGGVFVLAGLFVTVGRFFLDAWIRGRLSYGLTNQRLLIRRGRPGSEFTAVGPSRLAEARLSERADGSGTIRIGPNISVFERQRSFATGFGLWVPALDTTPQLVEIPNSREVFARLQTLAAGAQT